MFYFISFNDSVLQLRIDTSKHWWFWPLIFLLLACLIQHFLDYNDTIKSLQNVIGDLRDKNQELNKTVAKLQVENNRLKTQLSKSKDTPSIPEISSFLSKENPYFTENLRKDYLKSFENARLERALEHLVAPEKVTITATMKSFSSSKKYSTTLIKCDCDDFKCRQKPCKHMLSLAIFYNATYHMNDEVKAVLNNAVKEREATQKLKKEIDAKEKQLQKTTK